MDEPARNKGLKTAFWRAVLHGEVGLRASAKSTKDFPKAVEVPKGAPNILLIMTDDVGFGGSSAFGGAIPTPVGDPP